MLSVPRLSSSSSDFESGLNRLITAAEEDEQLITRVREVIARVRREGDRALLAYVREFDQCDVPDVAALQIGEDKLRAAFEQLPRETLAALEIAAQRIRRYAEKQKLETWHLEDEDGSVTGQMITALDSVGLYIPGGKAAYPSSVLMTAIPAQVAGVSRIAMAVSAPGGEIAPAVSAAAYLCRVDEVYRIGGAQAVAALAYGTETIRPVDKIVGPGNRYVTEAKRQVFGHVGIDMLAGPSEVLIVSDGSGDPGWIAADLFAQAEHDEQARAVLLCPDADFIDAVAGRMADLIRTAPRAELIERSISDKGLLLEVRDLHEAVEIVNKIAPEHLELIVADPASLLPDIRNAGAIFLGRYSPEVLGDYCAGPNHVLPTAGAARFFSPLGVYDFQKRSSLIHCTPQGAAKLAGVARRLAKDEGLFAHADSARCRLSDPGI